MKPTASEDSARHGVAADADKYSIIDRLSNSHRSVNIVMTTQQGLPRITPSTLHRYLKVILVTRKRVQVFHGMRNAQATKNNRILDFS
jgi:hypothetical protein